MLTSEDDVPLTSGVDGERVGPVDGGGAQSGPGGGHSARLAAPPYQHTERRARHRNTVIRDLNLMLTWPQENMYEVTFWLMLRIYKLRVMEIGCGCKKFL